MSNLALGKAGEDLAQELLLKAGYRVLARNFKNKLGEIDIIAKDKDTICFIEVKARRSRRFGLPQESVSSAKQKQIIKAALVFLKKNKLLDKNVRFDVVSVLFSDSRPEVELIKNAFEASNRYIY